MFVPLMFGDLKFGVDALAFNSLKKTFGATLACVWAGSLRCSSRVGRRGR